MEAGNSVALGQSCNLSQYGTILCLSNSGEFQNSLADGDWLDNVWAKHDSVFALFNETATFTLSTLQKAFTQQAQIGIEHTTLTLFVEFKRSLLWQRFLKAAFVQKFGTAIRARFAVFDDRDFVSMIPEDQPGVLSTIATPKINVYQARLDIGQMQFVAAEEVEDFTLFANVLSASSKASIEVPGKRVRLFGQILDMRASDQPKQIELQDAAYDSFELACDEFLGALLVANKAGSKQTLIVDGIRFGLDREGRDAQPVVEADVRKPPTADALPELSDNLQFAMTFAEAVVSDQRADPRDGIQRLVRDFLRWLVRFVPSDTQDESLLVLRVHALDLSHYAMNPSYVSFVPILPSSDYETYVEKIMDYTTAIQQQSIDYQQQIRQRKQEELIIDVAKALNHNIVETGKLLTGMIDANTEQQKDLVHCLFPVDWPSVCGDMSVGRWRYCHRRLDCQEIRERLCAGTA